MKRFFFGPDALSVRRVLAVGLLALAASVSQSCELTQESPGVRVSGQLTLKSSEPGSWWAVTDDEGRIWKIASPPEDLLLILDTIQNQRIIMEGCQLAKELNFEQIEPYLLTLAAVPTPAPEAAPAPTPAASEAAPVPAASQSTPAL